jgi:hypothetical protein
MRRVEQSVEVKERSLKSRVLGVILGAIGHTER